MKFAYTTVVAIATMAIVSGCCYRPCPRPCAPSAPGYVLPAAAPAPHAQYVKRMYEAPVEK